MVTDQVAAKSGMAYALHELGVPIVVRNGFDISREIASDPGFPQSAITILRRWHHFSRYPDLVTFSARAAIYSKLQSVLYCGRVRGPGYARFC